MKALDLASTEELENALVVSVLEMEQAGTLPEELRAAAIQLVRLRREISTHRRGGMVLNHEQYAEAQQWEESARAELIELCLTSGVFG